MLLAASYPYLKRYTYLPQVYLGRGLRLGHPDGVRRRARRSAGRWPGCCTRPTSLWSTAYDTWYAMVDRDDDIRMGSKSTAILFGDLDLVAQGVLYALFFCALVLVGQRAGMGTYYWIGVAVAAVLVAYEFVIARTRERAACFRAFLHNHWVGAGGVRRHRADFALRPAT